MAVALHDGVCRISNSNPAPWQNRAAGRFAPRGFGLGHKKDRERITMALSARTREVLPGEPVLRALEEADHSSCDLARDLQHPTAYNQEAFRYFLSNERRRSEICNRPFLLLLVELQQSHSNARIEPAVAMKLFSGLGDCLRDTDVIGWYHEGRVAGAVLTHVEQPSSADVSNEIRDRLTRALTIRLPVSLAGRLQVRVYQLPAGVAQ
jgi:hypothetical protein